MKGLNLVLSVVTFLFLIGLVIFIFVLFGNEMITATSEGSSGNINESINFTESGYSTSIAGLNNLETDNIHVYECIDGDCVELDSSNYTITGGIIYKN